MLGGKKMSKNKKSLLVLICLFVICGALYSTNYAIKKHEKSVQAIKINEEAVSKAKVVALAKASADKKASAEAAVKAKEDEKAKAEALIKEKETAAAKTKAEAAAKAKRSS